MRFRIGSLHGLIRPLDGWVRLGHLGGVRWRPAEGRLYSQRRRGIVLGRMWFGVLARRPPTSEDL